MLGNSDVLSKVIRAWAENPREYLLIRCTTFPYNSLATSLFPSASSRLASKCQVLTHPFPSLFHPLDFLKFFCLMSLFWNSFSGCPEHRANSAMAGQLPLRFPFGREGKSQLSSQLPAPHQPSPVEAMDPPHPQAFSEKLIHVSPTKYLSGKPPERINILGGSFGWCSCKKKKIVVLTLEPPCPLCVLNSRISSRQCPTWCLRKRLSIIRSAALIIPVNNPGVKRAVEQGAREPNLRLEVAGRETRAWQNATWRPPSHRNGRKIKFLTAYPTAFTQGRKEPNQPEDLGSLLGR